MPLMTLLLLITVNTVMIAATIMAIPNATDSQLAHLGNWDILYHNH